MNRDQNTCSKEREQSLLLGRTHKMSAKYDNDPALGTGSVKLERTIGIWTGMSMIVGTMIGSGIFVSTKGVLAGTGSVGLALVVWLICGIACILGSLVYVELGCELPHSGGDYEYINYAYGSITSFIFVWTMFFLVLPAANAIAALTFADYALQPFFTCQAYTPAIRIILGIIVVMLLTVVNCINKKLVSIVQNVSTVGKIFALLIVIAFGVYAAGKSKTYDKNLQLLSIVAKLAKFSNLFGVTIKFTDKTNFVSAIYNGLYSFAGWNTLNFIGGEIKRPEKNMPIAIIGGITLTTAIYFLVNAAYFVLMSPQDIMNSHAVAVTFAGLLWQPLAMIMSLFVALSTFGYLNGMTMATSRVALSAARKGHMPSSMCLVSNYNKLPICAVVSTGILSIIYVCVGDVYLLINLASCCEYVFIMLSVIGMIILRYRYPNWSRPFKTPLWIAVMFALCCLFIVIMTFVQSPLQAMISVGFIGAGLFVYYVIKKHQATNKFISKLTATIDITLQKITISSYSLKD